MTINLVRTSNTNPDFTRLTRELDAELRNNYPTQQDEYDKLNVVDPIETAIIGYVDGDPVACGCFKLVDNKSVEIKRMYVQKAFRRRGYSSLLLRNLESWASELGHELAILETGIKQTEAINMYQSRGYNRIDNYGPYKDLENSICMLKVLL